MAVQDDALSAIPQPWDTWPAEEDHVGDPLGCVADFFRWLGHRADLGLDDDDVVQAELDNGRRFIAAKMNIRGGQCDCCAGLVPYRGRTVTRWRLIKVK
jgi:hypothetical protein